MSPKSRTLSAFAAAAAGLLAVSCAHGGASRTYGTYSSGSDVDTMEVQAERPAPPPREYTRDEMRERRLDTLRSLSAELEDRAVRVARLTSARYRGRGHNERELEEQAKEFAGQAAELRERLSRDERDRHEVREELDHLNKTAGRVAGRLRRARVPDETYEEWNGVVGVLDELNGAAAGRRARRSGDRVRPPEPNVVIPRDGFDDDSEQ